MVLLSATLADSLIVHVADDIQLSTLEASPKVPFIPENPPLRSSQIV